MASINVAAEHLHIKFSGDLPAAGRAPQAQPSPCRRTGPGRHPYTASFSERTLFSTNSFSAPAHRQGQPGLIGCQEFLDNPSALWGQSDLLDIPPMGRPHPIPDEEFLVDQAFKRARHRVLHIFLRRPFCFPIVKLFQPPAFPPLSLRVIASKENIPLKAAQPHRPNAPITLFWFFLLPSPFRLMRRKFFQLNNQ